MDSSTPNLNKPLPPDVVFLGLGGLTSYRMYPVFSLRWMRGRFVLFTGVAALWALVTFLGNSNDLGWGPAGNISAAFLFAVLIMLFFGPALATAVRYSKVSARKEAIGVVAAVIIGIGLSWVVDYYSSNYILEQAGKKAEYDARQAKLKDAPKLQRISAHVAASIKGLLIYGLLGGGFALFAYFRERTRVEASVRRRELARANDARREAEMRLSLLQAQVEPHFLFNTLAGLRSMIGHDPPAAQAMVDKLVDYLRAAIPKMRADGEQEAPTLGDQLDIVKSYLDLMQIRMGKRLAYAIDVPESLREAQFPPLMLISLVENSLKHGLEPKPSGGTLAISASKAGKILSVSVRDDGVGFGGAATSGSGIGLMNIKTRLAQMYGDRASLTLKAVETGGVDASVTLPASPTSAM
ncbi:MAG: sensor histidine kinase [Burkholderiaceae bacterium]